MWGYLLQPREDRGGVCAGEGGDPRVGEQSACLPLHVGRFWAHPLLHMVTEDGETQKL